MLLFLDFDGVLHPRATTNLFTHLPKIEGVLGDFPHVQVVISSSWREEIPFIELQEMFNEKLRDRIIGTTPLVDIQYPPGPVGHREEEIRIFMAQSEYSGEQWLALDDEAPFFTVGCPHLILCNSATGLDESVEAQLRDKLMLELIRKHAQQEPSIDYCRSDTGKYFYYFYAGMGMRETHPIRLPLVVSIARLIEAGRLTLGKQFYSLALPGEDLHLLQISEEK